MSSSSSRNRCSSSLTVVTRVNSRWCRVFTLRTRSKFGVSTCELGRRLVFRVCGIVFWEGLAKVSSSYQASFWTHDKLTRRGSILVVTVTVIGRYISYLHRFRQKCTEIPTHLRLAAIRLDNGDCHKWKHWQMSAWVAQMVERTAWIIVQAVRPWVQSPSRTSGMEAKVFLLLSATGKLLGVEVEVKRRYSHSVMTAWHNTPNPCDNNRWKPQHNFHHGT